MKAALLEKLEQHLADTAAFQKQIKSATTPQIQRPSLKTTATELARRWFDEIAPALKQAGMASDADTSNAQFSDLLRMAKGSSARATYLQLLGNILAHYKSTLVHNVEVSAAPTGTGLSIAPYLEDLTVDEGAYLAEAQRCLSVDGIRACIVMGWCATVSRMHNKIVELGFDSFNKASEDMFVRSYGRFKPFNKKFKIDSVSELRRIFDTDLLWIFEFMELIDSNQHERLRHCFEFRNHSAHPGQAPISGENLYSFYSDITKIVLKNPKFAVPSATEQSVGGEA